LQLITIFHKNFSLCYIVIQEIENDCPLGKRTLGDDPANNENADLRTEAKRSITFIKNIRGTINQVADCSFYLGYSDGTPSIITIN
jgi:hypothetical protein